MPDPILLFSPDRSARVLNELFVLQNRAWEDAKKRSQNTRFFLHFGKKRTRDIDEPRRNGMFFSFLETSRRVHAHTHKKSSFMNWRGGMPLSRFSKGSSKCASDDNRRLSGRRKVGLARRSPEAASLFARIFHRRQGQAIAKGSAFLEIRAIADDIWKKGVYFIAY